MRPPAPARGPAQSSLCRWIVSVLDHCSGADLSHPNLLTFDQYFPGNTGHLCSKTNVMCGLVHSHPTVLCFAYMLGRFLTTILPHLSDTPINFLPGRYVHEVGVGLYPIRELHISTCAPLSTEPAELIPTPRFDTFSAMRRLSAVRPALSLIHI